VYWHNSENFNVRDSDVLPSSMVTFGSPKGVFMA
jgi:hypothetical protein